MFVVTFIIHITYIYMTKKYTEFELPPVVHVPEKLQVEVVDVVVDLLPVALHQLCVAHQLLLHRNTAVVSSTRSYTRINNQSNWMMTKLLY